MVAVPRGGKKKANQFASLGFGGSLNARGGRVSRKSVRRGVNGCKQTSAPQIAMSGFTWSHRENTNMRVSNLCGVPLIAFLAFHAAAQSTATYIGPNNGVWSVAGNWNVGQVPVNSAGATFNAIVPSNLAVEFDLDGARTLSGMNLQPGSLLDVKAGRQLTVSGVSVIAGMVRATGAGSLFRANSQFATLQLNARAAASNGATVRLGGLSYTCTGYGGDILSAQGSGSLLDLSSFGSLSTPYSAGCCGSYVEFWVHASDSGVVNLSSLTNVTGVSFRGWLRLREETGGKLMLPNLVTSSGYVIYESLSSSFTLPALQSVSTGYFIVPAGNQTDLPSATSITSSTIAIANGGVLNAPNLSNFDNSYLELNPQRSFNAPPLASINGAQFRLSSGSNFAVASTGYSTSSNIGYLLTADGVGTVFDGSTLTSFRATYGGGCCGDYGTNQILASNGGAVLLPGVRVIEGAGYRGVLRVRAETGGMVALNSLESTTGNVSFEASGSNLELPSLRTASSAVFTAGVFDTISAPLLEEFNAGSMNLADGAFVSTPSLTRFESSYIELTPGRFLDAPPFEKINYSRIFVREGKQFSVAATEYFNPGSPGEVFGADGVGSRLNLSSLKSFSAPWNSGCCTGWGELVVRASNGGTIDLSGLETVAGAVYNGVTRFDAISGGTIIFGSPVFASGSSRISADTSLSHVRFQSLSLRANAQLSLSLVASAHCSGNFSFDSTDENAVQLANGKLLMEGTAAGVNAQKLEVGSPNLGLPTGALPPSFQIGQLTIGRVGHATNVLLVDEFDNGNRSPGQAERLYLQGFPAENGLRILGGSTLYLGGIDLYAVIGNQWKRMQDLFAPEQSCISFDGGRICLGSPVPCPADLTGGGVVDDEDFQLFVSAYNILDCADLAMPPGCPADLNGDAFVDDADFQIFVVAYNALLCP